jgi:hypothetical protein
MEASAPSGALALWDVAFPLTPGEGMATEGTHQRLQDIGQAPALGSSGEPGWTWLATLVLTFGCSLWRDGGVFVVPLCRRFPAMHPAV